MMMGLEAMLVSGFYVSGAFCSSEGGEVWFPIRRFWLRPMKIGIYECGDTREMGRFSDIIIDMCRV